MVFFSTSQCVQMCFRLCVGKTTQQGVESSETHDFCHWCKKKYSVPYSCSREQRWKSCYNIIFEYVSHTENLEKRSQKSRMSSNLSLVRWRYLRYCDIDDFSPSFPIGHQLWCSSHVQLGPFFQILEPGRCRSAPSSLFFRTMWQRTSSFVPSYSFSTSKQIQSCPTPICSFSSTSWAVFDNTTVRKHQHASCHHHTQP